MLDAILQFADTNPTLSIIILVFSVLLNIVILCRPVIMFIVSKTSTQTDDKIAEKVYSLIDKLSPEAKQKLLDKMK